MKRTIIFISRACQLAYSLLIAIIIIVTFMSSQKALAVVDPLSFSNNRFGIHILFPEELEAAGKLVNSNGGDWGYVTIPIQSTDRNLKKWQKFMDEAKTLHLIPIIRLATFASGNLWTKPTIFDSIDFANFLNSLEWPVKNRYIIVYNEPNSYLEWGGVVDAAGYAQELSHTIDAFKRVNDDFFIISAGLDSYAPPRGSLYQNSYQFLLEMDRVVPGIFKRIDGFASHSYPANNFSQSPLVSNGGGIASYRQELFFIKSRFGVNNLPVFITETGWQQNYVGQSQTALFYNYAFKQVWQDKNIVAITPFVLNGQNSAFSGFSLINNDGRVSPVFSSIASLAKVSGQPPLTEPVEFLSKNIWRPVKNFQFMETKSHVITISPPWKAFLKWFFG